jgi:PAS domain S-box-containing protein
VKILANPIVLRAGIIFFCSTFAFLLGVIFIRLLRKSITEDVEVLTDAKPSLETLPLHIYSTVIQQLKQQKHELIAQSQAEQQRARTSETLSQAVLSNLSCGVLVFGMNRLVKTSNPAAKEILGFASTTGMGAKDIFRDAVISDAKCGEASDDAVRIAEEVDCVLHEGNGRRELQAEYETPAGERRFLAVTVSPVKAGDGELLGVACLINDISELEQIRRQQAERGELSAEMALVLRSSLSAISGYAQQLEGAGSPSLAKQLAADIAHEAASLDSILGRFLVTKAAAQSVAAGVSD